MNEIWKDIKDYEGMYQCSNFGRIRTLDRYVYEKNGKSQFKKGQIIKQRLNKNGYLQFGLNKNAKRVMKYTHIIIADTFIENIKSDKVVNHKDGNKTNNYIDNLEWCSYSENNIHSYKELKRNISNKGGSKIKVYIIDVITKNVQIFNSITEASNKINLSHTQINRYLNKNKKWKGRYMFTSNRDKCVEDIEKIS